MESLIKLKSRTITIPLPSGWKKNNVFVRKLNDTIVIKKVENPLLKLSDLASRISSSKMSNEEIEKEIRNYRKNK